MNKTFRMAQSSPMRSDCTADFTIQLYENYTVEGFINAVLDNNKNEWGFIKCFSSSDNLKDILSVSKAVCEYKRGKLVSEKLPDEILNRSVVAATASGGYSRMDYRLLLDTETDVSKINLPKGFEFDENGKPVRTATT